MARALVIKPPSLLLDEPLSNLDAKLRHDMQTELRQTQGQVGTTTIMVTHDQDEALVMSDRVALSDRYRIVHFDRPSPLCDDPGSHFAADFIDRANLLDGEIVLSESQRQFVCGGGSLAIEKQLPCGQTNFSLRPECIDLVDDRSAALMGHVICTVAYSLECRHSMPVLSESLYRLIIQDQCQYLRVVHREFSFQFGDASNAPWYLQARDLPV